MLRLRLLLAILLPLTLAVLLASSIAHAVPAIEHNPANPLHLFSPRFAAAATAAAVSKCTCYTFSTTIPSPTCAPITRPANCTTENCIYYSLTVVPPPVASCGPTYTTETFYSSACPPATTCPTGCSTLHTTSTGCVPEVAVKTKTIKAKGCVTSCPKVTTCEVKATVTVTVEEKACGCEGTLAATETETQTVTEACPMSCGSACRTVTRTKTETEK